MIFYDISDLHFILDVGAQSQYSVSHTRVHLAHLLIYIICHQFIDNIRLLRGFLPKFS